MPLSDEFKEVLQKQFNVLMNDIELREDADYQLVANSLVGLCEPQNELNELPNYIKVKLRLVEDAYHACPEDCDKEEYQGYLADNVIREFADKLLRQREQYRGLALDYLDKLPIEEWDETVVALEYFVQQQEREALPESLQQAMNSLYELYDEPEMWVQNAKHYCGFQALIRQITQERIDYLNQLDRDARQQRIAENKQLKQVAIENQQLMEQKQAPKPGDAAYVVSEEQRLAQQQFNFQHEQLWPEMPETKALYDQGYLTMQQMQQLIQNPGGAGWRLLERSAFCRQLLQQGQLQIDDLYNRGIRLLVKPEVMALVEQGKLSLDFLRAVSEQTRCALTWPVICEKVQAGNLNIEDLAFVGNLGNLNAPFVFYYFDNDDITYQQALSLKPEGIAALEEESIRNLFVNGVISWQDLDQPGNIQNCQNRTVLNLLLMRDITYQQAISLTPQGLLAINEPQCLELYFLQKIQWDDLNCEGNIENCRSKRVHELIKIERLTYEQALMFDAKSVAILENEKVFLLFKQDKLNYLQLKEIQPDTIERLENDKYYALLAEGEMDFNQFKDSSIGQLDAFLNPVEEIKPPELSYNDIDLNQLLALVDAQEKELANKARLAEQGANNAQDDEFQKLQRLVDRNIFSQEEIANLSPEQLALILTGDNTQLLLSGVITGQDLFDQIMNQYDVGPAPLVGDEYDEGPAPLVGDEYDEGPAPLVGDEYDEGPAPLVGDEYDEGPAPLVGDEYDEGPAPLVGDEYLFEDKPEHRDIDYGKVKRENDDDQLLKAIEDPFDEDIEELLDEDIEEPPRALGGFEQFFVREVPAEVPAPAPKPKKVLVREEINHPESDEEKKIEHLNRILNTALDTFQQRVRECNWVTKKAHPKSERQAARLFVQQNLECETLEAKIDHLCHFLDTGDGSWWPNSFKTRLLKPMARELFPTIELNQRPHYQGYNQQLQACLREWANPPVNNAVELNFN